MEAKVEALQVDHVVSPTTPRDGLMIKPTVDKSRLEFSQLFSIYVNYNEKNPNYLQWYMCCQNYHETCPS